MPLHHHSHCSSDQTALSYFRWQVDVSAVRPHRGEHSLEWHGAGAGGGGFTVHLERPSTLWGGFSVFTASQSAHGNLFKAMCMVSHFTAALQDVLAMLVTVSTQ